MVTSLPNRYFFSLNYNANTIDEIKKEKKKEIERFMKFTRKKGVNHIEGFTD